MLSMACREVTIHGDEGINAVDGMNHILMQLCFDVIF